jgi:hypothetical protein
MFDRQDLAAAVKAGVLSSEQASAFEDFLKRRTGTDRMLDSESLRFLASFNDIFLAIGMAILLAGVSFLSGRFVAEGIGADRMAVTIAPIPVLIAAWGLAEYFCGRRRLLLPSMVLAVVICLCTAAIAGSLLLPDESRAEAFDGIGLFIRNIGYAGFGGAALGALAIFLRFRLPFSLFLLALSLAGLFYTAIAGLGEDGVVIGGFATLAAGLATLVIAIVVDARDPARASLASDCAFWLHFAAAPQIMIGMRSLIVGSGLVPDGVGDAAVMLLALVGFGLISLALNRRALIVSGLISFAAAIGTVLNTLSGGNDLNTLMLTLLVVGGSIVLLGGGWRTARRWLLKLLPQQGVTARIFPPEPA